jgi:hypothetical protein
MTPVDQGKTTEPGYRTLDGVQKNGMATGTIMVLVVGALIISGGSYWAMNRNHQTSPATTGQGSPSVMAPVTDKVSPLPQTSPPQAAPAPATTTEPDINQGVDSEESPTMPKR